MSVKIGIGFGGWPFPSADPDHLWEYTDLCERYGVDSLWHVRHPQDAVPANEQRIAAPSGAGIVGPGLPHSKPQRDRGPNSPISPSAAPLVGEHARKERPGVRS